MKKFNQSPLPFQGQKRRFITKFKEELKGYEDAKVFVDLFGGSGLLSHTVKYCYPHARVVWNDFDNFQRRLDNIENTNSLLCVIRRLLGDYPRDKKIANDLKLEILKIVKEEPWVDYITLSSNLLFSGKYVVNYEQLESETFYNVMRKTDYDAEGYLAGVERIQRDYRCVFNDFKELEGVVFLVDPPYLSTDTKTYNNEDYWRLRDYLDVLDVLEGNNYFYFTSNKSQIVELCEWIETRTYRGNPFKDAVMTTTSNSINYNSSYTDIMIHKRATN